MRSCTFTVRKPAKNISQKKKYVSRIARATCCLDMLSEKPHGRWMSSLSRATAALFCWGIEQPREAWILTQLLKWHQEQGFSATARDPRGLFRAISACVSLTLVFIAFVWFWGNLICGCLAASFFQVHSSWPVTLCFYSVGWFLAQPHGEPENRVHTMGFVNLGSSSVNRSKK